MFVRSLVCGLILSLFALVPGVAQADNPWWCGGLQYLVVEVVNTNAYGHSPTVDPPLPLFPSIPPPLGSVPWGSSSSRIWFNSYGARNAYWRDVRVDQFADFMVAHPGTSWGGTPWSFLNFSHPEVAYWTTGEQIGFGWWGSSSTGWWMSGIYLSNPLPDSAATSPREERIGFRTGGGYYNTYLQTARVTCLVPQSGWPSLGTGPADNVTATGGVYVYADSYGCWRCSNY